MVSIKLTNLASYRSYFQALATGANHHKEIDGYKWGEDEVLKNDNLSDMPARVLWATPYDKTPYEDQDSDNVHKRKVARVAYLKTATTEKFSDIDTCFDECEAVMEQIAAKLLLDKRGYDVAGVWTMIVTEVSSFTGGPVEMIIGSTKYYGWELEFTFKDPANLAYDASKWN